MGKLFPAMAARSPLRGLAIAVAGVAYSLIGLLTNTQAGHAGEPLRIAGWRETAVISAVSGPTVTLAAKLDTGADNSSLDARKIERFVRDGVGWVRFRVADQTGEWHQMERPELRQAAIRRAGAAVVQRPVVMLQLCVAGQSGVVEVTLADRSELSRPLLVGRSFLAGRLLVDAAQHDLGGGTCEMAGTMKRGGTMNRDGQPK